MAGFASEWVPALGWNAQTGKKQPGCRSSRAILLSDDTALTFHFCPFFGSTVAFAAESFEPLVINGCGVTHMPPWQGVLKQELAWAIQAFIESSVSGRRE